jgi:hypothetical protein
MSLVVGSYGPQHIAVAYVHSFFLESNLVSSIQSPSNAHPIDGAFAKKQKQKRAKVPYAKAGR